MKRQLELFWKEKIALAGMIVTILIGVIARSFHGSIYGSPEAQLLIESLTSSTLYLGSAIAASSATVLALMLTLTGLVKQVDEDFDEGIYRRVSAISRLSATNLAGAVLLLMLLSMPVGEFDDIPGYWYIVLYNILYSLMIGLCALSVGIVLLLMATVDKLIMNISPESEK